MTKIRVILVALSLFMCSVSAFADEDSDTTGAQLNWLADCVKPDYDKIYYALELDPIGYFEPPNVNTDLEKKLYKNTAEYKENLKKLKDIRKKVLSSKYCFETPFKINEYNTARKGIEIEMGENPVFALVPGEAEPAKSFKGFYFPSFMTYEKNNEVFAGSKYVIYSLSVDENKALDIERQRYSIKTYLIFSLDKIVRHQFRTYIGSAYASDKGFYKLTKNFLKAKAVTLVLADPKENKVYLRKDILDRK